jgi:predicted metal-dependent phosphoesterase TrpH
MSGLKKTTSFISILLFFFQVNIFCQELKWYKGNLHAHTINSDGNSSPDVVVRWYKEHGYNFCVLSDHNYLTDATIMNQLFGAEGKFLVIPGEEITDRFEKKPVHLTGVNINKPVMPQGGYSVPVLIDNNATAISRSGGISVINHPNGSLKESISASDIMQTNAVNLFEVCCADFKGGNNKPSTDEIWDSVLTKGKILYGVAADDAHRFETGSIQPGTAWIMVHAKELSNAAVMKAINDGDFYATTGVDIQTIEISNNKIKIELATGDIGYKTFFIGNNGRLLKIDQSYSPTYTYKENDGYVRARIERSDGTYAWIQPVMTRLK